MFCPNCGTKLDETTKTCPNCGLTLTPKEEVEPLQDSETLETNTNQPTPAEQPPVEESVDNLAIDKETQALLDEVPEEAKNEPENPPVIEVDKGPSPLPSENHIANQTPQQNNKTAMVVMIGIVVFIILFLLAIYLIFYYEDAPSNKAENNQVKEENSGEISTTTEKELEDGSIEATIKTDNGEVTFIVPKVCTGSEVSNNNTETNKLYMSDNLECMTLGFLYIPYGSAEEEQESHYTNPYMDDVEMRKFTVKLNNGVEAYGVESYEGIGSLYYPIDKGSCIEISLSLNELTEKEINKYVIVKE